MACRGLITRRQHRQVRCRFLHTNAPDDVPRKHPDRTRRCHRADATPLATSPICFVRARASHDADCSTAFQTHQRLHFDQQRSRALARHHHHNCPAWERYASRPENRQTDLAPRAILVAHCEHAEFVDRAESVLERAQYAETRRGFAFQKYSTATTMCSSTRGPAMPPSFVTLTHEKNARPFSHHEALKEQYRPTPACLAHRNRRCGQQFAPDGLDRIDHQHAQRIFRVFTMRSTHVSARHRKPSSVVRPLPERDAI